MTEGMPGTPHPLAACALRSFLAQTSVRFRSDGQRTIFEAKTGLVPLVYIGRSTDILPGDKFIFDKDMT